MPKFKFLNFLLLMLVIILTIKTASAFDITLDISKEQIVKGSEFKSSSIGVSGIMKEPYDIILKVTGPLRSYKMSRKESEFGIWVKKAKLTIPAAKSYLYLSTSRSIEEIADAYTLTMLDLDGKMFENNAPTNPERAHISNIEKEFCEYSEQKGLYLQREGRIEIIGNKFYRDIIPISERAVSGTYEVVVYAFSDGLLVAQHSKEFTIKKNDLYTKLDEVYDQSPLMYALASIGIAILSGIIAAAIFTRRQ